MGNIIIKPFRPGDIFLLDDRIPTGDVRQHNYVMLTAPDDEKGIVLAMTISQFSSWQNRINLVPVTCSNGRQSYVNTESIYTFRLTDIREGGKYHGYLPADVVECLRKIFVIRSGLTESEQESVSDLLSLLRHYGEGEKDELPHPEPTIEEEIAETETETIETSEITENTEVETETPETETKTIETTKTNATEDDGTDKKKRRQPSTARKVDDLGFKDLKRFLELYTEKQYDIIRAEYSLDDKKQTIYNYRARVMRELNHRAAHKYPNGMSVTPVEKWSQEEIEGILCFQYLNPNKPIPVPGLSVSRAISLRSEIVSEAKKRGML